MATTTTNFSFTKPGVADPVDADLWGGQLNTNFDNLDGFLKTARDFETVVTTATTFSVTTSERNKLVLADTSSNAITVNLLAAATAGNGFEVAVKITDATNAVTIDGNAAETIDGAATFVLSSLNDTILLVSDGSNWFSVAKPSVSSVLSGQFVDLKTISTTSTYTPTAGVNTIVYMLVGASAGGGSSSGNGGNSGTSSLAAIATAGAASGGPGPEAGAFRGTDAVATGGDIDFLGQIGGNGGKRSDGGGTYFLSGDGGNGVTVMGVHTLTAGEKSSGISVTIGAGGTTPGLNGATVGDAGKLLIWEYK